MGFARSATEENQGERQEVAGQFDQRRNSVARDRALEISRRAGIPFRVSGANFSGKFVRRAASHDSTVFEGDIDSQRQLGFQVFVVL